MTCEICSKNYSRKSGYCKGKDDKDVEYCADCDHALCGVHNFIHNCGGTGDYGNEKYNHRDPKPKEIESYYYQLKKRVEAYPGSYLASISKKKLDEYYKNAHK